MHNRTLDDFMRRKFDEAYEEMVKPDVKEYLNFINGVNISSVRKNRNARKEKQAEEKMHRDGKQSNNDNAKKENISANGGDENGNADKNLI